MFHISVFIIPVAKKRRLLLECAEEASTSTPREDIKCIFGLGYASDPEDRSREGAGSFAAFGFDFDFGFGSDIPSGGEELGTFFVATPSVDASVLSL